MRALFTAWLAIMPLLVAGQDSCPPDIRLERALFAGDIRDREPWQPLNQLPADAPAIYFFTHVAGAAGQRIRHVWSYDGEPVATVNLPVGGNDWRTWSSKNLGLRRQAGWSVRVLGPEQCLLGTWHLPADGDAGEQTAVPLDRIHALLASGDLAGARLEAKKALASGPPARAREALQSLLEQDLVLARVEKDIQEQALFTARSRLDALLSSSLPDDILARARVLEQRLIDERKRLNNEAEVQLEIFAKAMNATLAGGDTCAHLAGSLDRRLQMLAEEPPYLVTGIEPGSATIHASLLDRRTGDGHEVTLSCLPSPGSHLPGSPP